MITCPRCGFQAPDTAPYCPNCGFGRQDSPAPVQPGPQMPDYRITCPNCGLKNPPGSRFCSRCGYQFPDPDKQDPAPKKKGLGCGALALIGVSVLVILLGVVIIHMLITLRNVDLAPTPVISASKPTGVPILPTRTPAASPTPTKTPEPTLPPLCNDHQMDIIRLADALDTRGFPFPDQYMEDRNACVYRISERGLFGDVYGYLSLFYDTAETPTAAIVEIYYKDNTETRELIADWGAASLAYVDQSTNILTAPPLIRTAQTTGYAETRNYGLTARLDPDTLIYTIGIVSLETISTAAATN